MQDDWNRSQDINNETHDDLPWADALRSTSESSTPNIMLLGQASSFHEMDNPWEQLNLAHQRIEALQEQCRDLERTIKQLTLRTLTDQLTGLRNRRRFQEDLESAWTYAVRHNLLLSVIVLDLDEFKSYNDAFGETAGDQLLCNVAGYMSSGLRAYDVLARLGGGQFALLLPSTDRTDARRIAERLRKGMEQETSRSDRLPPASASPQWNPHHSRLCSLSIVDSSFAAGERTREDPVTHFIDLQNNSPARPVNISPARGSSLIND